MTTYFVLFDPIWHQFAKAGRSKGFCSSISFAKHFTSEWSAKAYQSKNDEFASFIVKKIQRY